MDIALGVIIIFPVGATIIGLMYLRMFYKLKMKSSLVSAVLWIIYSIYELLIYMRILCTGECNIRIDLLIIYPTLIVSSLLASFIYFRIKRKLSIAE